VLALIVMSASAVVILIAALFRPPEPDLGYGGGLGVFLRRRFGASHVRKRT
jgi:hypothetical protein